MVANSNNPCLYNVYWNLLIVNTAIFALTESDIQIAMGKNPKTPIW